mmetsp:Transcript_40668/g.36104  ORF Transcript_40668/g.36104 Transcript_40668/m.36104 type:complete len:168 (-) Transcript_40668:558-1061(-)|eukprot:CAMPEP_0114588576 /NCGR_PEP_ID=MMETSP0125-20121206/11243_1 /TAXON_ID=485358 ORGANISM="Aristerostoma sp., Strain ATCC 50986" /NCGR_SAMPLE_ID=MMETSP0125 /ASSEMBLY_ACC=CAM_ASM_000245 /LENGTH=167 /DNA_ID=CAMNT_0001785039 /DNA_START=52 /DNA_END=555 /DNA_ORIENTATION=+
MMKAIGFTKAGGVEVLKELKVPIPKPGPNDILVNIKATAINPVDYKIRQSSVNASESNPVIPGFDASGVVAKVGEKVTQFKEGDEVFYAGNIRRNGTYAEYHTVDSRIVGRKPTTMSHFEAAGVPLVFLTAYEGLVDRMEIPADKTVNKNKYAMIIPGGGGVGSMAI